MRDYFVFKGVNSQSMGIVVEKMPIVPKAAKRVESKTIPGRHGELHITDGTYGGITLSIDCVLLDRGRMDDVFAWLDGSGDLVLSSVPGKAFRASVFNQIPLSKVIEALGVSRFAVVFTAGPFRYEFPPIGIVIPGSEGGRIIQGKGSVPADPIITINGNGNITFMVSGHAIMIDDVQGGVVIDCEAGVVYRPGMPDTLWTNKTTLLGDDWPTLKPGNNAVSWTGSVSSVIIQPNWRWV